MPKHRSDFFLLIVVVLLLSSSGCMSTTELAQLITSPTPTATSTATPTNTPTPTSTPTVTPTSTNSPTPTNTSTPTPTPTPTLSPTPPLPSGWIPQQVENFYIGLPMSWRTFNQESNEVDDFIRAIMESQAGKKLSDNDFKKLGLKFMALELGNEIGTFIISQPVLPITPPAEQMASDAAKKLEKTPNFLKPIKQETVEVAGETAYVINARMKMYVGGKQQEGLSMEFYFEHDRKLYIVSIVMFGSNMDAAEESVMQIMGTFRWVEPSSAATPAMTETLIPTP